MFSMSAKARAKLLARLTPLLPAGSAPPVTVVRGAANAAWTRGAVVVAALFGVLFVVAATAEMGAGSFPTPPAPSAPTYLAPASADTTTW